jgi:dsDNA-binding SOS-regulon protein
MAVITQYVVQHKGVDKLVTTDKKAADQYDKMLNVADNLAEYISAKGITLEDQVLEDLSIVLAKHKDSVQKLLKGSDADAILESESAEVINLDENSA